MRNAAVAPVAPVVAGVAPLRRPVAVVVALLVAGAVVAAAVVVVAPA